MRRRGVRQFVKFAIVGASGTVVNFLVAHALERTTHFTWFADFAVGFMVGGISNYIFNRIWTFGSRRNPFVEGIQFLSVSALALVAGGAVFSIAQHFDIRHFTATWFVATLSGTFVNFFMNKYWTFRHLN